MNILDTRSRALAREVPLPAARDRGPVGVLLFLLMALVFVPVVGLHVVCLTHFAPGPEPVAAAAGGSGGARAAPAIPARG